MTSHVVIGGGGFIGRHLVRALQAKGDDVLVVGRSRFLDLSATTRSLRLDLSEATAADFDTIVQKADVVHCYAWTTIPAQANADPLGDLQVNLKGALGLLDALKRRGGGRIVFASSGGTVYGPITRIPVQEDHALNPITAYGISKVAAEKYFQLYRYLYVIDTRVVRISNPYGAGQNPAKQQGVVTALIHHALADAPIEIWGTGETVRDFIHINDLIRALMAVANLPYVSGEMPLLNIGYGDGTSLNTVVQIIENALGKSLNVTRKPTRAFDVPINILDITRARQALGWEPTINLQAGIDQTIVDLRVDLMRRFASGQNLR
jgi:UDP-glucose 4-epimerase